MTGNVTPQQHRCTNCLRGRPVGQMILQIVAIGIIVFCIASVAVYNSKKRLAAPAEEDVLLEASNNPEEEGESSVQSSLLEIAEEVVLQCSEETIGVSGTDECQRLCEDKLCCYNRGEYSCEDDESMNCPVYAACEALLDEEAWEPKHNEAHVYWG